MTTTLPLLFENSVQPKGLKSLSFHTPDLITKELKLSILPSGLKRIRLSSNFLPLMGFTTGKRVEIQDNGVNQGLTIRFNAQGAAKIYERTYTQRKNNPLEAQVDIQNQSLIDRGIPEGTERLHFTLRQGSILIKPLFNHTFSIRRNLKDSINPLNSFVAMTAGVDAHCLFANGFTIDSLLEYRPQEARDKTDLTETGAVNALANVPVKNLFNEDISKIDWTMVKDVCRNGSPIGLLHLSLQCDDFSNSKAKSLKEKSIENLDTSADLVYDGLRLIETIQPACIVIENVPGFKASGACELLKIKLRKWGYHLSDQVLDARQHHGLTSRQRYYLVASVWPGFTMPAPEDNKAKLWSVVKRHLPDCRDITHTQTVYQGIEVGRSRIISEQSEFAPTLMKSQNRQAKDSVFIESDGRFFMPNENLLRELNGFPEDLRLDAVSETVASEIIGQSIEYPMHDALIKEIKTHISNNCR